MIKIRKNTEVLNDNKITNQRAVVDPGMLEKSKFV